MLANIGISWYIAIEQGKDIHPSSEVLESLAAALRLSDDERRYLFLLAKSDKIGEPEAYKEISIGLEDTIIDRNIFLTNSGSLIKKSGAQLTQRQTTKFEVV